MDAEHRLILKKMFKILALTFLTICFANLEAADEIQTNDNDYGDECSKNLLFFGYCSPNKTYGLTNIGNIAVSTDYCESTPGIPRSSIICVRPSNDDICDDEYNGVLAEEVLTDCDETLEDIIHEGEDDSDLRKIFPNLVPQLQLFTANTKMINITTAYQVLRLLERLESFARTGEIRVNADPSMRYILAILSQLSEFYESLENDDDDDDYYYDNDDKSLTVDNHKIDDPKYLRKFLTRLQRITAQILPQFCFSSSFAPNRNTWMVNTGRFFMMAEDHQANNVTTANFSPNFGRDRIRPVSVSVPGSVIEAARKVTNSSGDIRTVFIYYNKPGALFTVNSSVQNVVSVDVGRNQSVNANLSEPVVIKHLNVRRQSVIKAKCVFWDFTTRTWSGKGCFLRFGDDDRAECVCSHLTNFAIIVSPRSARNLAQIVVSQIAGFASIIGLLITITVFSFFRELRKHTPGKITLHVCSNLCVFYILLFAGVTPASGNSQSCAAVAFLFHYFQMTSWSWMGVYTYQIYMGLVKVFHGYQSRFMLKATLISYLVPAAIAFITFGIAVGVYSPGPGPLNLTVYHSVDLCQLTRDNYVYLGFAIPIGVILFFNIIVFVLVTYELQKKKESEPIAKRRSAKQSLSIAITMISSMGLVWIFGFVALFFDSEDNLILIEIFNWFFVIFAAFQGFGIFLLTIVRKPEIRKLIIELCQSCRIKSKKKKHPDSSLKSSSSNYTPANCKSQKTESTF